MQAITITARNCVRGSFQQFANLFESICMPDFQDDDFALFDRQFGQATHGGAFLGRFTGRTFEPAVRFHFAREPAPQAAAVVQRTIAEAADAIMIGLRWRLAALQQRHERLLQNVLRFDVA